MNKTMPPDFLKKIALYSLCIISILCIGCLSLDPFLFPGKEVDGYKFDQYTDSPELADALDTVKSLEASGFAPVVSDSCIHQYTVPSGSGEIAVVVLSNQTLPFSSTDTMIVFFRGNGPHIDHYWPRTRMLHATGYPVAVLDYRGFGMSAGEATEASISEDGRALMKFIGDSLGNPRLVVYSYSLGSLVGCDLLANTSYPGVVRFVLEAPIGSIATHVENGTVLDIPGTYLSNTTSNNIERIKSIHVPLLWLHGTLDATNQRETHGLPIWNNYSGEGHYLKVTGAIHTTCPRVIGYARYIQAIKSYCNGTALVSYPSILSGNGNVEWGTR